MKKFVLLSILLHASLIFLHFLKSKKYQQTKDNIFILCKRMDRISNLQRKILKQFVSKKIIVNFYYVSIIIRYILSLRNFL